ncbi:glycoprotein [Hymenopteran chu-related virus OKIAV147]|uniref:Glycoprotein n=1 Tax=Hymenopteran chu-related virus OKIAV147 TaxID=2789449 RepID=A0A7U3S2E6_9VIRU|nr:glycoprotein [Hymenopteran chu-related virus OKIAV147]QPB73973.1 glycoprotein [Hymenopteran chu-related virus OKIAV147]
MPESLSLHGLTVRGVVLKSNVKRHNFSFVSVSYRFSRSIETMAANADALARAAAARQAGLDAAQANAARIGPGHNQAYYQSVLQSNPLFSRYVVKNTNAGLFVGDFANAEVAGMVRLLSDMRFRISGLVEQEELAHAHACLELMIPLTSAENFVNEADARRIVIDAVRTTMRDAGLKQILCPGVDHGNFQRQLNAMYPPPAADPAPAPVEGEAPPPPPPLRRREVVDDDMVAFRVDQAYNQLELFQVLSIEQAMKILRVLASYVYPNSRECSVEMVFHMLIAICKQGNATIKSIQKMQQDVSRDLDIQIELHMEVVKTVHRHSTGSINETSVAHIIEQWNAWIPAGALRARLTVQQASFVNLTSFVTIGRAIRLYATFPWARVAGLYPVDVENFIAAEAVVAGNQYFGFARDLGVVRSTKYKNLAWLAKELLVRIKGETSLTKYKGWVAVPAYPDVINGIIDDYIAGLDRDGEEAENPANGLRLVNAVRADRNGDLFTL